MNKISLHEVSEYVGQNIGIFHQKRIRNLDGLKLSHVLKRKNPYLFRAKHVLTAEQIVKSLVDAHISSNEETLFGDWLEDLALFVNQKAYSGWKSELSHIDLEFDADGVRYIVTINSGPKWSNSKSLENMRTDFKAAKEILQTNNPELRVVAVNGCCYGKDSKPDKGDYFKYCGQHFWEFISGDSELFTAIVEPLGHLAKEKNEEFQKSYAQMINRFTREFANSFCNDHGEIKWDEMVRFNSSAE